MLKNFLRKRVKRLHSLYIVGLLFSISQALVVYSISTYLAQYVGEEKVGFFFTLTFIVAMIGLNTLPKLLARNGVLISAIIIILGYIGALALMGFVPSLIAAVAGFIIYHVTRVLFNVTVSIFVERNSIDSLTGGIRGALLTISDLGWLVVVFVMGYLLDNYGFNLIYLISGLIMLAVLIVLISNFKLHEKHLRKKKYEIKKVAQRVFGDHNLRNIFFIDTILQIFYSIMVIYIPIYLYQHIGFSWTTIGFIFTVMLLPFVIFPFPAGKLADKYFGEKEIMTIGLIIAALSTASLSLITEPNVLLWMVVLFLTRTGASLVGVMSASHFYKQIDGDDIEIINFMQNSFPLGYIIAPLLASLTLIFLPLQYIFVFLAATIICAVIFSLRLKDSK